MGKQAALWWSGQAYRWAIWLACGSTSGRAEYEWAVVREGWWAVVQAECCVVERIGEPVDNGERPDGRLDGQVIGRTGV